MKTLEYFWINAIRSMRRGKFRKRSWIFLFKIFLYFITLFMTGRLLGEIEVKNENKKM